MPNLHYRHQRFKYMDCKIVLEDRLQLILVRRYNLISVNLFSSFLSLFCLQQSQQNLYPIPYPIGHFSLFIIMMAEGIYLDIFQRSMVNHPSLLQDVWLY